MSDTNSNGNRDSGRSPEDKDAVEAGVNQDVSESSDSAAETVESNAGKGTPSPFNCISGSAIAGSMAVGLYFLATSIAGNFAAKPLASTNPLAQNISALVRTTVVGVCALGTGIVGSVALGLLALGIQTLVRGDRQTTS